MTEPASTPWLKRALQAVVTLIVIALGARLAWDLLRPLLGGLIVLAGLLALLGALIRRFRGW
jgi:hypothetical protein